MPALPRSRPMRWLLASLGALVAVGGIVGATLSWTTMPHPPPDVLDRYRRSPAWSEGRFANEEDTPLWTGGRNGPPLWRYFTEKGEREPAAPLPNVPLDGARLGPPPPGALRFVWLGHSSLLLDLDGVRLLVDPVWATNASPVDGMGPRRFLPPPLPLEDLPDPDLVILTHDHYDHLDKGTILHLAGRGRSFLAPLGVGQRLRAWGVAADRIQEVDWGETVELPGGLRLTATSTRHFSGRGLLDRYRTLWCAWAVVGPAHRVFLGGDGGYGRTFAEMGRTLGPFDLAFLEIGAWDEAWANVHLGPDNALLAARDLTARWLVPIHWGTFNLAFHPWYEPAERLAAGAEAAGVTVAFPRAGDVVDPTGPAPAPGWWRGSMGGR